MSSSKKNNFSSANKLMQQQNLPPNNFNQFRGGSGQDVNTSQQISAQKDSRATNFGGGIGVDSDSAANLISKAQVHEVIKSLNIREGMFTEDDIKQLEDGYSVSQSDDDLGSGMNDILSAHSYYNVKGAQVRGMAGTDIPGYSPQLQGSPGAPNAAWDDEPGVGAMEQQMRYQQFSGAVLSELTAQKQKFGKRINQMEKQIDQLRMEKSQLAQVLETQRANFKFTLQQQENRSGQVIRELKDGQKQLVDQLPAFQEKLELYKQEFGAHQLLISEENYVELKMKQNQSLKEFIQVKVYDTLQTYIQDLERHQLDNNETVSQLVQLKGQYQRERMEKENMARHLKDLREDSSRRIDALERRNQELESDNQNINSKVKHSDQYKNQAVNGEERIRKLEMDNKHTESNNKILEQQLLKLQDGKNEVERRAEQLRREIDLLTQDKNYLQRENGTLMDKVKRLDDKLDRTEQSLLEAKKQAEKYMDRVLNTNDDLKMKFDQQYSTEIQDLKARYTKDLEMVKQNLIDIYETKTAHLTERRDELDYRNNKLEKQLSDRQAAYEELLYEFRNLQKNTDEETGHLRIQTRSRDDEINRVTHLYEDNLVLVKETKLECEALKCKIDLLKTEYYKLESHSREGSSDIKAQLAVATERLANYELIEKELDQAIMNVAGDASVDDDGTNTIGNALIQTITSAPTASKRRIQQSLLLANRLQTKQKENEKLQKDIVQKNRQIEDLESKVKLSERLLTKTNQPQSYMIADIERAEKELDFANRKIKQLDDVCKKLKHDNETLKMAKKGLADDLQKLSSKRQDIENLQTTLMGIIQHSSSKKIDVDDLKVKLAESIRKDKYNQPFTMTRQKSNNRDLMGQNSSQETLMDQASTMKMYNHEDPTPVWYKSLKKGLK